MHLSCSRAALAAAALAAPPASLAAPPPVELDPMVVTASRTEQGAFGALASSIVIDRDTIERTEPFDAVDLLGSHAGVDIGRNGGPGQPASIFIRGTDSNHALVMLDGVKINPGTIGGAPLQDIDPVLLDHIEVVKGPRSTLYGSEALGGVVNISTRRATAEGTGWRGRLAAGSDATTRASLGVDHNDGSLRVGLALAGTTTEGFPPQLGSTIDRGYDNATANVYAGATLGEHALELRHWQSRGNSEYLDFSLAPVDEDYEHRVTALQWDGPLAANWKSRLILSRVHSRLAQNQSSDFADTNRDTLDWQHTVALGGHHLLVGGLTVAREQTDALSFGTGYDETTDSREAYLEDRMRFGAHDLVLAARHTHHDSFGDHGTWSVAYGYAVDPATRFYASAGTAFRAPDSTDRFGFGGNPRLDPETARSLELGLKHRLGSGQTIRAALFHTDIDDLINFHDPDGFGGPLPGQNQNVDRARIRGIEAGYELRRGPWRVLLEAVAQDPKNRATGEPLARRARHSLSAEIAYSRGRYELGTEILAVGERRDSDFSSTVNAPYAVVNVSAHWRLGRELTLGARIENLLDRDYVLADGFNSQSRALLVTLRYERS